MQSQIDNWVISAINLKDKTPNEAIIEVLTPEKNKVTQDILERVVEGYNLKMFNLKKQDGFDMENSFPIADSKVILSELLKLQKKACICRSIVEPEFKSDPIKYIDEPAEPEYIDPNLIKHAELVLEKYMKELDQDSTLADELRALYPYNTLLKQGNRNMPSVFRSSHAEFGKMQKIACFLKEAYQKKKSPKGESESPKGESEPPKEENLDIGTWKGDYEPILAASLLPITLNKEDIVTDEGKIRSILPTILGAMVNSTISAHNVPKLPVIFNSIYDHNKDLLQDFEHQTSALIKQIKAKSMFTTLMNHDPQLKNADPVKMLSVFNTLSNAAPDAASDYPLVKSVLRSANAMGEGVIDPTTMTQLYKMQKEYKARNMDSKLKAMMRKMNPSEEE